MADGWTRHLKNAEVEAYSAGCELRGVNPRAIQVMAEAGVDISQAKSKLIDEFADQEFDCVVMVCDYAAGCPPFAGMSKVVQVAFDNPVLFDEMDVTEEERLAVYRRVRDEIRDFVLTLPDSLGLDMP